MGVKEIIEKIKKEGEEEIRKVMNHYESRVAEIKKEQEKEKKHFYDAEMEKIQKETEEIKRGIILSAKLEKRKKILWAKRDNINRVLDKIRQGFQAIVGKDAYYNYLKTNTSKLIKDGDKINLSKDDVKSFGDKLVKDLKKKIEVKEGKMNAGLIIERGNHNINISISSLIEKNMEVLEKKIGTKLNVL